jgi:hypothetical protein
LEVEINKCHSNKKEQQMKISAPFYGFILFSYIKITILKEDLDGE